jgi:hypothetical protein
MSQKLYADFLLLFKRFPIDSTKKGHDLGEFARKKFSKAFTHGELTQTVDISQWTKTHKELERLVNNEFFDKYPRVKATGALNLGREHCKLVVSNDYQKMMGVKLEKIVSVCLNEKQLSSESY